MNDQYYGDRIKVSDDAERTDEDTNNPDVKWDLVTDKVIGDAALIYEMPVDETAAADNLMNVPLADTILVYETPVQAIPLSATAVVDDPLVESVIYVAPVTETVPYPAPVVPAAVTPATLLSHEDSEHFRTRWNEIQGTFVDEPRAAVQQADALVSEVIEQITRLFTEEHSSLEGQWKQGNEVSTEELRKALQHYRSFFNRLVV